MLPDPSQNYLEKIPQPLDAIFFPKTVALIGAKDDKGSVARTILANLQQSSHTLFPINPKRKNVFGIKAYPTIKDVSSSIDLAIIVTPAKVVPKIIGECVEQHVKSAIVISAGFKELGSSGVELENEILAHRRKATMPIIGPNCLGVMNPISGLNATFAKGIAKKGNVAFISQSGALCTAVLDWSLQENLGFSAFVSVGSMLDVGWADLINYFGSDPNTRSILLYMETVGDPHKFLSAAREVALQKPIVVIKPGRTAAAAKAAASHTGSLVGDDAVFEAALERVGVLRVRTIAQLFDMAEVLAKQPLPQGPNLGIITNAGGPAVLATDAAIGNGATIVSLSEATTNALNSFLPNAWSRSNPVDLLGDASADTYEKAIQVMSKADEFDGILTILTPQDMTEPEKTAQSFARCLSKKPLLASWMGAKAVEEGNRLLNQANICTFGFPDEAASAFAKMWRHHENLRALYSFSSVKEKVDSTNYEQQKKRIAMAEKYRPQERKILSEDESKAFLSLYQIPIVETKKATNIHEATALARSIGYPVVLKLLSSTITHKSDVQGVQLHLTSKEEVGRAFETIQKNVASKDFDGVTVQKMITFDGYELIVGSSIDPQFGPVILFGAGGEMVEIYQDTALGLPPLDRTNAFRLMAKTKIAQAFKGYRGKKAVDTEKLAQILINFSQMIVENPWICECDMNPVLAGAEGIVALDARIVANPSAETAAALRSYPYHYCTLQRLQNGTELMIRPIKGDDVPLLIAFHKELSDHTVHQRFLKFLSLSERVAHERLVRICLTDYTHEFVLVAELNEKDRIVAVTRLSKIPSTTHAQLFMVIDDAFQRQGLGSLLIRQMMEIASQEGITEVIAKILSENKGMISLCKKNGFKVISKGEFILMRCGIDKMKNVSKCST